MKVKPSVKKICDKCKVIRRHGRVMVICDNLATSSARASPGTRSTDRSTTHSVTARVPGQTRAGHPRTEAGARRTPGGARGERCGTHDLRRTEGEPSPWHVSSASTSRATSGWRSR